MPGPGHLLTRASTLAFALVLAPGVVSGVVSAQALAQPPASPLQSRFLAEKLVPGAGGDTLEPAANVAIGDTVQYSAWHTNVSDKRLLRVDFYIPIPDGTRLVPGSAEPPGALLERRADGQPQMHWRVAAMAPGQTVRLSLRVRINPDPSLTPLPAQPVRPELR